jgi:hypothetical protein
MGCVTPFRDRQREAASQPIDAGSDGELQSKFADLPNANRRFSIEGSWQEVNVELHLACDASDAADDLVIWHEFFEAEAVESTRHEVGKNGAARRRGEMRLEHIGVWDVAPYN